MSDNSKSQYSNRLTVHITGAMEDRLEQIASQRDEPKAEVVRAALRAYLDKQEDLIGSRKHFTKMFQRRVDYIERLTVDQPVDQRADHAHAVRAREEGIL